MSETLYKIKLESWMESDSFIVAKRIESANSHGKVYVKYGFVERHYYSHSDGKWTVKPDNPALSWRTQEECIVMGVYNPDEVVELRKLWFEK